MYQVVVIRPLAGEAEVRLTRARDTERLTIRRVQATLLHRQRITDDTAHTVETILQRVTPRADVGLRRVDTAQTVDVARGICAGCLSEDDGESRL